MAKIDFTKVEQSLSNAMQHWFQRKISKGESASHAEISSFFGVEIAKPGPQDSVIAALAKMEKEGEEESEDVSEETLPATTPLTSAKSEPIPEKEPVHIAPMFILRQRLLWFIHKRVVNIYNLLGTTKEEIISLRKKKAYTPDDESRIKELLVKTGEVHERLMKRLGLDSDTALVENEKKRHLTKRFNIRETWLPL